jgi:hypothetical protein
MYTEIAKFEFNSALPQSARLSFLASMATALEKSISVSLETDNPGFSLELDKNGVVKATIWQPWKRNTLWSQLRHGQQTAVINVTLPKNFSDDAIGSNAP